MTPRPAVAFALGLAAAMVAQSSLAAGNVSEILQSGDYRFCTDTAYRLDAREQGFCDGISASSAACPALAEACKLPPIADDLVARPNGGLERGLEDPQDAAPSGPHPRSQADGRDDPTHPNDGNPSNAKDPRRDGADKPNGSKPAGSAGRDNRTPPAAPPPDPPAEKESSHTSFGGLGLALFISLAVVFFGVVAWFIWKNVERRGDPERAGDDEPGPTTEDGKPSIAKPDVIETDVARLLARARARAESDPRRAMEDAYAALLRRLEGDGLIHLHPSRTNGDYLRAVRERADLRSAMAGVVRDLERVQFGTDDATPSRFRSIYERVLPWVGRAAAVAAIWIGASTSLSCHAASGSRSQGGGTTPWETRAIAEILQGYGHDVTYQRTTELADSTPPSVVFLPSANVTPQEAEEIAERVTKAGGTVVFAGGAPRRLGVESTSLPGDTGALLAGHRETDTGRSALLYAPPTAHFTTYPRLATVVIDRNAARTEAGGQRFPYAVSYTHNRGNIIAFADGALFHNIALAPDANADFLRYFLSRLPRGDVDLYDTAPPAGAESPVESVANAHLTPILLQLLAAATLLFLYKGVRFGHLRDVAGVSRRAFVEHVRAIGAAFRRAGASHHALGLFGVWAMDRLRERGGSQRGTRQLARVIAARTGNPEAEVLATLQEVRAARSGRDDVEPPSSRQGPPSSSVAPTMTTSGGESTAHDVLLMQRLDGYLRALTSAARGRASPGGSPNPPVSDSKA